MFCAKPLTAVIVVELMLKVAQLWLLLAHIFFFTALILSDLFCM
jgi:hypothetical protein